MGIYDRPYYREERTGGVFGDRAMVYNLIILNVAVYLADVLSNRWLADYMMLTGDVFKRPWELYRLVTYGFVHQSLVKDTFTNQTHIVFAHLLFNMFGLWMFGRDVESIYGRREFLGVYLTAVVLSGLVWLIPVVAEGSDPRATLEGASGAVMCVMLLYVLHYPRRTFYMIPIPIPIPAWALGVMYVAFDIIGLDSNDQVAHVAHLAGAAYGFAYYRTGWQFGRLVPRSWSLSAFKFRPRLKIHDPPSDEQDLGREVDRILEKISREGEASLSKQERSTLERASRRYQQRKR